MYSNSLAADGLCRRVAVGGHIERFCIGRNEKGTGSLLVGSGTLRALVGRDVEPAEYDGRDVV